MPMGTLSFTAATPFHFVEISIPPGQTTADFLVDNVIVTTSDLPIPSTVPEPATYLSTGIALLAVGLARRR
jgi:hypothetical protein